MKKYFKLLAWLNFTVIFMLGLGVISNATFCITCWTEVSREVIAIFTGMAGFVITLCWIAKHIKEI